MEKNFVNIVNVMYQCGTQVVSATICIIQIIVIFVAGNGKIGKRSLIMFGLIQTIPFLDGAYTLRGKRRLDVLLKEI
jgi:hypothetical protein